MAKDPQRDLADAWADVQSAAEPLERVDAMRRLRELAEAIEHDLVRDARAAGLSWSRIGALYGLTKQGAQQRFRAAGGKAKVKEKDGDG